MTYHEEVQALLAQGWRRCPKPPSWLSIFREEIQAAGLPPIHLGPVLTHHEENTNCWWIGAYHNGQSVGLTLTILGKKENIYRNWQWSKPVLALIRKKAQDYARELAQRILAAGKA